VVVALLALWPNKKRLFKPLKAILVFPHHLFEAHPAIEKHADATIVLIEEYLFFSQYKFHKQKLAYHRATMQRYANALKHRKVTYINATEAESDIRNAIPFLQKKGYTEFHFCEVTDYWLHKRIYNFQDLQCFSYKSPLFINSVEEITEYAASKEKLFQTDFYVQQRKKLKILVTEDNKPIGGKWSYDAENRKAYPNNKQAPPIIFPTKDTYFEEAKFYVEKNFSDNYGIINEANIYPTNAEEAKKFFKNFLEHRLMDFGIYEDSIVDKEIYLHHSILTPMLNIGLLTPQYILDATLAYYELHPEIPLNSIEGFIRQIIGWREFIRLTYHIKGREERTKNYWNFSKQVPESFWNASTTIAPIDDTIEKIIQTGYCHHIERLMVLGNFMLLNEYHPNEVYKWFMEMFIDSYDWVMVPNVYGMSQFADGGLMATKPYISGSNYLLKMSNYKKGDWCVIWDALFWQFMQKQRNFFLSNPRLGMLIHMLDKMDSNKRESHFAIATAYLNKAE
jgi:deoxyribodipyrimidine photolyase-related protein